MPCQRDDLRGVLDAWRLLAADDWHLEHLGLSERGARWDALDEGGLRDELRRCIHASDDASLGLRVYWKRAPALSYWGCNRTFAEDHGLAALVPTLTDLRDLGAIAGTEAHARMSAIEARVVAASRPTLNRLHRLRVREQARFVRTSLVPIVTPQGCRGVLGMQEVFDATLTIRALLECN